MNARQSRWPHEDGPRALEAAPAKGRQARVIVSNPDIMGGTPVFAGTRVPVEAMIDYLKSGDTLDEFLDQFPSVSREKAVAALEEMAQDAMEIARAHRAR
jgi:uncharacterized protein (DUF433 family)